MLDAGAGWEVRVRGWRRWIIPGVVLLAVVVGGGGWLWMHHDRPAPAAAAAPPPITASDVDSIVSALNSEDPAVVRSALAVAPAQPLEPELVAGIQALRPIEIDASTLKPLGSGTWQARAQVGDADQRASWTVFLTKVEDVWKLAATAPSA